MEIARYSEVTNKNKREILLLKASPCKWGRCTFCDYILDNSNNTEENIKINEEELKKVTGKYGVLEVINSGSCFELPKETLESIKKIVIEKNIHHLIFEAHWIYRNRLNELRDYFNIPVTYKLGLETFDDNFRNNILNKGIIINSPLDVSKYYDSICLMVGIKGQTKESIDRNIEYLLKYFKKGCINIWIENSTKFKRDLELIKWFKNKYSYLDDYENVEVLWNNTDFGVGGEINED